MNVDELVPIVMSLLQLQINEAVFRLSFLWGESRLALGDKGPHYAFRVLVRRCRINFKHYGATAELSIILLNYFNVLSFD
jgi:hypothetical protein